MRPALVLMLLLAACTSGSGPAPQASSAPPPAPVAPGPNQVWRGTISCDPIPGIVRKVRVQRFQVDVSGGIARYERTVLQADSGIEASIHERGEGAIAPGGPVTLKGQATGGQYTYTAEYSGRMAPEDRIARLTGYQHWRFAGSAPADRPCQITLRRQG
ncbi:MAG TPA: hypothetical protein VE650_15095 [Acetobacteraceae bacterium]|nr:hypothetical protein [Acetobacteraceae bacterium]